MLGATQVVEKVGWAEYLGVAMATAAAEGVVVAAVVMAAMVTVGQVVAGADTAP